MTAFLLQTALMMLVAYFAGAFLGCIVRRTFFAHTLQPAAVKATRPAVVVATSNVASQPAPVAVSRFERALTGTAAPVAATPAPMPAPVAPAPVVARPVVPAPLPAPAPAAAPAVTAPAPAPLPISIPSAAVPSPAVAAASAAAAAAMAAVAAARAQAGANAPAVPALPAAMGTSGPATVVAPIAAAPVAAAAAPKASPLPQDLTRIRAIDEQQQKQLNALGVGSFSDIAAWRPEDVARIGAALKIPGRIEQENWIEQAQILAKGGETYYSRRKSKGEFATSRPTPDEGDRITVRVPAGTRPSVDGVAAGAAAAAPPSVDLKTAAASAASAVLAAQASVVPGVKAVAAAVADAAAPTAAAERPVGMSRDALQRIAGINGEVERLLNVQGVTRFDQIAGWNANDVGRFDRLLGFEGRVARENWIEQAQILSKGGETAYSREMSRRTLEAASTAKLADALPARPEPERASREDLSALRSVRSEAYRTPEAPGTIGPAATRKPDDLKRIRGVGVLIEKKLNALGVTRYDQVANWSAVDIERFSEKLDFKGRIERENWVEQARILSAGGQTEFSQRVDRGEVESSKPAT